MILAQFPFDISDVPWNVKMYFVLDFVNLIVTSLINIEYQENVYIERKIETLEH